MKKEYGRGKKISVNGKKEDKCQWKKKKEKGQGGYARLKKISGMKRS